MGRESCLDIGCILRVAKCDTRPKRSNSRVRQEDGQISTAICHSAMSSAVETLGALADDALIFLAKIGRRATSCTADPRKTTFLYQRISVAIQPFNAVYLAN